MTHECQRPALAEWGQVAECPECGQAWIFGYTLQGRDVAEWAPLNDHPES